MGWIALEDAAQKYGIPSLLLANWLEEKRIAGSLIGGKCMVSEDCLSEYLEEFLLTTESNSLTYSLSKMKRLLEIELSTCSDTLYALKTQKECGVLYEIIIRELTYLLPNASDKKLFYDISTGKSIGKTAARYRLNREQACERYQKIIDALKLKQGEIAGNLEKTAELTIRCNNYEAMLKADQGISTDKSRDTQIIPGEIPPCAVSILAVPVSDLFPERRIVHILHQCQINTLEDILRLTKTHGFRVLGFIHGLGRQSRRQFKLHLIEKGVIDEDGNSYLYKYIVS